MTIKDIPPNVPATAHLAEALRRERAVVRT
jgi:hypothetical protein